MIPFFGNYYGGLVVKNLKKVFYVICGVALVFVVIIFIVIIVLQKLKTMEDISQ